MSAGSCGRSKRCRRTRRERTRLGCTRAHADAVRHPSIRRSGGDPVDPFTALAGALSAAGVRYIVIGVWGANYYAPSGTAMFLTLDRDLFASGCWRRGGRRDDRATDLSAGTELLDVPRDVRHACTCGGRIGEELDSRVRATESRCRSVARHERLRSLEEVWLGAPDVRGGRRRAIPSRDSRTPSRGPFRGGRRIGSFSRLTGRRYPAPAFRQSANSLIAAEAFFAA